MMQIEPGSVRNPEHLDPVVYEIFKRATGWCPEVVDALDPIALDAALERIVYHA